MSEIKGQGQRSMSPIVTKVKNVKIPVQGQDHKGQGQRLRSYIKVKGRKVKVIAGQGRSRFINTCVMPLSSRLGRHLPQQL